MKTTAERLRKRVQVLDVIDKRRRETGDSGIGAGLEQRIIAFELREIEAEILANPGALEALLVRVNVKAVSRRRF